MSTTAADGTYQVTGIAPGSRTITYSKTGYTTQQLAVVLTAGENRDLGITQLVATPPPAAGLRRTSLVGTWTELGLSGFPTSASTVVVPSTHPGILWDTEGLQMKKFTCHSILQAADDRVISLDMFGNFIMHHGTFTWSSNFAGYIEFHVASEANFVGGNFTGDPPDSEVGLFLMNTPHTILGPRVVPWGLATAGIAAGATTLTLDRTPTGWAVGDKIGIAPTLPPWDPNWQVYDEPLITAIAGSLITFSPACVVEHPALIVGGTTIETPEIMNLERRLEIRGTSNSLRSHVMVMAHDATAVIPISVKNLRLRWMGPRKLNSSGDDAGVLGRYPWHLHELRAFSAGAIFDGVLAKDCGNRCFVRHASHLVTYQDCVAHNITGDPPYWHDTVPAELNEATVLTNPNATNDIYLLRCIASKVTATSDMAGFRRLSGYALNNGLRNRANDCRAFGVTGGRSTAGIHWPEAESTKDGGGTWETLGFVGHNCTNGGFTWQNTNNDHQIFTGRSRLYHNAESGYEHGAYRNVYKVGPTAAFAAPIDALILYGNGTTGLTLFANSKTFLEGMIGLRNSYVDGVAGQTDYLILEGDHFADPELPTRFVGCTFRNAAIAVLKVGTSGPATAIPIAVDFTNNDFGGLTPCKFDQARAIATSVVRVQGAGFAIPRRYMKATNPGSPNAGDDFYDSPSNASVKNIAAF